MAQQRMLSAQRQRPALLLLALLVPAVVTAEVGKTEAVAAVGEGPPTIEKVAEETKADAEGQGQAKGKRQALYSGPFSSLLPAAYQLPAEASAGSADSPVTSGSSKAAAYQPLPLAGVGLPLGYGSASAAFSPSFPGLLGAASAPPANHSSAGSPLAALLSAATPAAQFSAPHNFSLPVAANLLTQGSSYLPGGGFYASAAAPSAANFPQNSTFGQPAASSLFAQNSAAYPSFYPAPAGFKQNFNAGLFGAASTAAVFPGSVVAQGGIAPDSAGGPFTFYSYPVAGKSGQQAVGTVGVSNQLLAPHRPLSLAEAKQRFPNYFSGVEEPYARFQQQLQQLQQPQQPQQLQQPLRPQPQQLQKPMVPVPAQHGRPVGPPKPAQVTEFPEEQRGGGYARPPPTPASSDATDEDDDGSYKERPAYKSGTYHSGAGVDHHKIRAEQESEDEDGSDRHPNSYQRVTFHKPHHGEEESGKSSYPGYYPKAAYYKKHHAASSEDDEDSGRPQESSSEDDEDEEDHRPAYSYSYQRFPSAEVDSHFNRAAAESLSSSPGGPRPAAQTLHTYRFKLPDYATETYSPVTGRPSRTKGRPYQERAEEDEDTQDEDSEGRYSSPRLRVHKATWSYSRSQSSTR